MQGGRVSLSVASAVPCPSLTAIAGAHGDAFLRPSLSPVASWWRVLLRRPGRFRPLSPVWRPGLRPGRFPPLPFPPLRSGPPLRPKCSTPLCSMPLRPLPVRPSPLRRHGPLPSSPGRPAPPAPSSPACALRRLPGSGRPSERTVRSRLACPGALSERTPMTTIPQETRKVRRAVREERRRLTRSARRIRIAEKHAFLNA